MGHHKHKTRRGHGHRGERRRSESESHSEYDNLSVPGKEETRSYQLPESSTSRWVRNVERAMGHTLAKSPVTSPIEDRHTGFRRRSLSQGPPVTLPRLHQWPDRKHPERSSGRRSTAFGEGGIGTPQSHATDTAKRASELKQQGYRKVETIIDPSYRGSLTKVTTVWKDPKPKTGGSTGKSRPTIALTSYHDPQSVIVLEDN